MGLKSTPFWVSWFLTGLAFSVISVLVLIIMGLICQIDFFLNTPFMYNRYIYILRVIFALFVFFSMSMVMLALFISTVVSHQKTAYAVSYGFLLAGIVMQVILSNPMMIYLIFYPEDVAGHTYFIRTLFALYPPFSFSKMFGDISQVCASHYSPEDFVWVEGRDYEYADLFREMKGTLLFGDKYIVIYIKSKLYPGFPHTFTCLFAYIYIYISICLYILYIYIFRVQRQYGA